jgi:hypothetical protein
VPVTLNQGLALRTVKNAIRRVDFNNLSGGIDGRPTALYISSKIGDISFNTASANGLIARRGCRSGTLLSGETRVSIVACFVSDPRMPLGDHIRDLLSIPCGPFFNTLLRNSVSFLATMMGHGR